MFAFSPEVIAQMQASAEQEPAPVIPIEREPREYPMSMAESMGTPRWEPTPWPEPFDESAFRDHLDALHARAAAAKRTWPQYVKRVQFWCAMYDNAQADNERMAIRLKFLQEPAASCPFVGMPDEVKALLLECRRGPWTPEVPPLDHPIGEGQGA